MTGPERRRAAGWRRRRKAASARSQRALDWLNFFVADVQTGFGPFVAVYLTEAAWTQADIGAVLSVGTIVVMLAQMPIGALIDAAPSKRAVAGTALVGIGFSALLFAAWPIFPVVLLARVVHGLASCALGPAIAAISLGLVGHRAAGERLGRNASFASIGTGIAAAVMGALGHYVSSGSVFLLAAVLGLPALWMLILIRTAEIDPVTASGGVPPASRAQGAERAVPLRRLAENRGLLVFAGAVLLFQLANAAMLPIVGGAVTKRSADWATVLIAACIVVPQLVVALFSPWVGRQAERLGRRPMLLLGFAVLPVRALLFALVTSPYLLVPVQILDGISAAVLGVLTPLIAADVTRGTGRFNLAQGFIGAALGVGASLSTITAGIVVDRFGEAAGFLGLAGAAFAALALVAAAMPETRPEADVGENEKIAPPEDGGARRFGG